METVFNKVNPDQETDRPKKCWCKRGKIIAMILIVLIVGAICCHIHRLHHPHSTGLELGTYYTVHLCRNAVDGSAPVSVKGRLIADHREAILLDASDNSSVQQFWIPKSNILFIEHRKHFLGTPASPYRL